MEEYDEGMLAACIGKQKFPNPRIAREVAKRRRQRGKKGDAYRCRYCHQWHIGFSPRRKAKV